ncbi:MAG: universal stress protein, partial [Deltaproteobacteria bacterium]|nr:universal stress protein [Deltaproteobacteria bacterium]
MQIYLVTTDLSEESKASFATAAALARRNQAKIVLLAVIEDAAQAAMLYAMEFPVSPSDNLQRQFLDTVTAELQAMAAEFFADLESEIVVIESSKNAALEITAYAAKHKVDLIIMSTRGKS